MLISGITPFSLLDYPGKASTIVFTPGCNYRCGFCHNPEFVVPEQIQKIKDSFIPEQSFFRFLDTRKGLLDGVVITGGEPTLQHDLEHFIRAVRARGFLVKLDSNGNRPEILEDFLKKNLVDYVAMDVKTSPEFYKQLAGPRADADAIQKSIDLLMNSGIDYEFRSTLVSGFHTEQQLKGMAEMMKGARELHLQTFRPEKTLDPAFEDNRAFSKEEMHRFADDFFAPVIKKVCVRA